MATIVEEVESAALQLPRAERARLAELLIESLDEDDEIERAWAEEVVRRIRQIDSGEVELIDGELVIEEMRSLLR